MLTLYPFTRKKSPRHLVTLRRTCSTSLNKSEHKIAAVNGSRWANKVFLWPAICFPWILSILVQFSACFFAFGDFLHVALFSTIDSSLFLIMFLHFSWDVSMRSLDFPRFTVMSSSQTMRHSKWNVTSSGTHQLICEAFTSRDFFWKIATINRSV